MDNLDSAFSLPTTMAEVVRHRMLHAFPEFHVRNLGGGTIGPVYLNCTPEGQVLFADAKLHGAPFEEMIIDSPELLRMFKDPRDPIDVTTLGQPWPMFRLVERAEMDFHIGRLEQEEYVRADSYSGFTLKGHPYQTKMQITASVIDTETGTSRAHSAPKAETQATRQPKRVVIRSSSLKARSSPRNRPMMADAVSLGPVPVPVSVPPRPTPMKPIKPVQGSPAGAPYSYETALPKEEAEILSDRMSQLKQQLWEIMSAEDQVSYEWLLTTGLRRQGKEGSKFRARNSELLKDIKKASGSRGEQFRSLHNQYAELQHKLERRWPYHIPVV